MTVLAATPSKRAAPRVLLVDDDESLGRVLGRSLRHFGIDVTLATCGKSAMSELDEKDFDVVLLDLQMPDMNGLDLLRTAAGARLPATILHSAYVDVPTTVEAMQAGAHEVLQKPTSAADLARRIHALSAPSERAPSEAIGLCVACTSASACHKCPLLIGESPRMRELRGAICRVAAFHDLPVLIEGPTGTGKELVARSIHALCAPEAPIVSINCAAIPGELFESELFGYDSGAFTGAKGARVGLLEEAGRGVLFLDEVGELPVALQAKLLRVLETREFRRVGSSRERRFEARLVCATNRHLADFESTTFRSDLYFRIAGYTIRTPALAEHAEDIPALARFFIDSFSERNGLPAARMSPGAEAALMHHAWPGNVRELRAVMQNAMVTAGGGMITRAHLQDVSRARGPRCRLDDSGPLRRSLPEVERDLIVKAYEDAGENLTHAARALGIPRTTLRDRLRRYGMR